MPFALWCVLVAKDYDNNRPRDPAYWKDGFRARAAGAQANGFEAFPMFAVAVIVGLGQGGDAEWIDSLAALFIAMRLVYVFCYWSDRATPRSLAWAVGFASTLAIFTSPVWS
jgi:uncharacterized MAPEG superfamily protein